MVSAIITTYERDPAIIERAINSIKKQTHKDIEIIVVDDNADGSQFSEALQNSIRNYDGIIYIKQAGNTGACAARNAGISAAHGEYIGFLDDDDEWLPDKIEKQIKVFEKNRLRLGMVYCSGYTIDDEHEDRIKPYTQNILEFVQYKDLLREDRIGTTSNPLIRREILIKTGGFMKNQPARQDYELWIRISRLCDIIGINDRLFLHHMHSGDQISKNSIKSYKGYRNIYKEFMTDIKNDQASYETYIRCLTYTGIHSRQISCIEYCLRYFALWSVKKARRFYNKDTERPEDEN